MKRKILASLLVLSSIGYMASVVSCDGVNNASSNVSSAITSNSQSSVTSQEDKLGALIAKHNASTVSEAVEKANNANGGESEEFVCAGKIVTVSNATYGEMTLTDGKKSIYVYGLYDFSTLENKPIAGDYIVIKGKVKIYKDQPEFSKSTMIEFVHEEKKADASFEKMTVLQARSAKKDAKVSLEGVVGRITYANGMKPNGFFLIDDSASIYIYGQDAASQVEIGNKVVVEGVRDNFIAETEQASATKFGYQGAIQIKEANVITNDKKKNDIPIASFIETTIKNIIETPLTDNITSKVFKVNALVKKDSKEGFTNYYFDDLDGKTGSYTYTACNGSDFAWLDEFDNKVCTVYLSPINCKSTAAGCVYRFVPIEVKDENYTFDESKACDFAFEYFLDKQFDAKYEGDPCKEVLTNVSLSLFDINDINVTYTSSNEDVAKFVSEDDKLIFHTYNSGTAKINVTATRGNNTVTKEYSVKVVDPNSIESITISEAIAAEDQQEVTVKGIVGPSLVNQVGFYLMDETGTIAVKTSKETMSTLAIGDEVILKATRVMYSKDATKNVIGQSVLLDATIEANLHGNKTLPFANVITNETPEEIHSKTVDTDYTTNLYKVTGKLVFSKTNYSTSVKLYCGETSFELYCSSASQFSAFESYSEVEGEFVIALCNWNKKNFYKIAIVSATFGDTQVLVNLNFNK